MSESKLQYQLDQYVDLYKFHWELALKICIFFLGISGAVSAYVLKNQHIDYMSLALVLPIGLCSFGAWLSHRSMPGLFLIRREAQRIGAELQFQTYPEFRSLVTFVGALRYIFGASVIGLLGMLVVVVRGS